MLTRIEIDGFKSFEEFSVDLMPLSVIVGANASGKSNLFDALRLLARVAVASDLREAFRDLRGRPEEQFRKTPSGTSRLMRFAVECLLNPEATDSFGTRVKLKNTRLRYELEIERRAAESGIERLFVAHEAAKLIPRRQDPWNDVLPKPYAFLRERIVRSKRQNDYLVTQEEQGRRVIEARQDGVPGRPRPAERATASYLSTMTDAEAFPHLFALRQELAGIAFLQIDPAAEREPSDFLLPDELEPNARNLAAVLHRMRQETATEDRPDGALADVTAAVAMLLPGVARVLVTVNEQARQYELGLELANGQTFSSRVLSDGTLRLLALVAVMSDPRRRGTLCFEEPENGVHPGRIGPLLNLLRETCRDPEGVSFQVVMNSHSPLVLKALDAHEIVFAEQQIILDGLGPSRRRTRMRSGATVQGVLLPADSPDRLSVFDIDNMLRSEIEVEAGV